MAEVYLVDKKSIFSGKLGEEGLMINPMDDSIIVSGLENSPQLGRFCSSRLRLLLMFPENGYGPEVEKARLRLRSLGEKIEAYNLGKQGRGEFARRLREKKLEGQKGFVCYDGGLVSYSRKKAKEIIEHDLGETTFSDPNLFVPYALSKEDESMFKAARAVAIGLAEKIEGELVF